MRDLDLRIALEVTLEDRHQGDPGTMIRHELGLGAGRRRVDLAVVNGEIAGFELKSDEDTLSRLAGQAELYSRVFDRVTLVTTQKYVERATAVIPEWWGIMTARCGADGVELTEERPSEFNASPDPFSLAQLLWRDEALEELKARGLAGGMSRRARHYVWQALADALPLMELRAVVRRRLKERTDWPGGQRRAQGDAKAHSGAIR